MSSELLFWANPVDQINEPTSIRARRAVAPMLISAFMLLPGTTSGLPPVTPAMLQIAASFPTAICGYTADIYVPAAHPEPSATATATAIRRLHEVSGLTWDELARAFGVSRRTVHAWANGSKLNQTHSERLSAVARLIDSVATDSPPRTRAALHAPTSAGESPYQRLIRSFAQPGNRREGFAPWELLSSSDASSDQDSD
jgi:hypothetical protein